MGSGRLDDAETKGLVVWTLVEAPTMVAGEAPDEAGPVETPGGAVVAVVEPAGEGAPVWWNRGGATAEVTRGGVAWSRCGAPWRGARARLSDGGAAGSGL